MQRHASERTLASEPSQHEPETLRTTRMPFATEPSIENGEYTTIRVLAGSASALVREGNAAAGSARHANASAIRAPLMRSVRQQRNDGVCRVEAVPAEAADARSGSHPLRAIRADPFTVACDRLLDLL
jgi:hypothetical protein